MQRRVAVEDLRPGMHIVELCGWSGTHFDDTLLKAFVGFHASRPALGQRVRRALNAPARAGDKNRQLDRFGSTKRPVFTLLFSLS